MNTNAKEAQVRWNNHLDSCKTCKGVYNPETYIDGDEWCSAGEGLLNELVVAEFAIVQASS